MDSFGLKERDLQEILFESLDRLIGDDELLLLMKSRSWREEPDLMALDREGNLHIFEVKVWESRSENLLQVLRYGQLFGAKDYDALDKIWRKTRGDEHSLARAHADKFGIEGELAPEKFNRRQIFIVLTNGLDVETREAIRYWKSTGLDVRPWIYRAYNLEKRMLLEIVPFRVADDPLEDQVEQVADGYYVVNTNYRNSKADDDSMLAEKKVAAYFEPWKFKIARLKPGDFVFLYRSGVGVVAAGRVNGKLRKSAYHGDSTHAEEEYSRSLNEFVVLDPPLSAAQVKAIADKPNLIFCQTMFGLDQEGGRRLFEAIRKP
ncbi:MAG TPA: hypothetical protein VK629_06785 [Steroidobacteraceae bacterium]|nr:hypothetical protein [Steroidobacteraceae bacterium]